MMQIRMLPPLSAITENLSYDPMTGIFKWKIAKCWHYRDNNREAGCVFQGRRKIGFSGYGQFLAHRLAWKISFGHDPVGEIDHIDGNPLNNAVSNLREATSSQQKMNKGVQSNNRSGLKGAYFHSVHKGKKWRSQIKASGKLHFLGYFDTAQEAHEAYMIAAEKFFGEFMPSVSRHLRHQERIDAGEARP